MTDQPTEGRALAPTEQRQIQRVENLQPMLDTARFEHFQRAASALMHSSILNESVRGNSPQQCFSNLMLVFDLSDRWKLPALSIAQGIAIVHNKVVYEGKLITAMLRSSLGVTLHYHYTGERGTDAYRIYVSDRDFGDLSDADMEQLAPGRYPRGWRMIDGSVADWKTLQKDGRTPNPAWTGAATRNQLAYRGSREWARLYEPAQMLGVYGDDELDDMQVRMDRARDVTPAPAPGLSGGFTRPAEKEALEIIGEVTEIVTETVQDAAGEPQDAEVGEKATDAPADDKASPAARKKPAAKSDAKREQVLADRAAALETATALGREAQDAAAWGNDDLDGLLAGPNLTDEDKGFIRNGWAAGRATLDLELEEAYDLGRAGTPMLAPGWLTKGDKAAERRWDLIRAEWTRGGADGTAEAKADAALEADGVEADTDQIDDAEVAETDEVDEDADGDDTVPRSAIDAWIDALPDLADWKSIKASMNALTRTDAWDDAPLERKAELRRLAWLREADIISAGDERMDFINDLTAFRCWIETTDDVDAINGNWMTLVRQPIYTALAPENRHSLEQATMGRVKQIQEAAKA